MAKELRLLGSGFNKVSGYRNDNFSGKLEIKSNATIKSIEKLKDSKDDNLRVLFVFDVDYGELGKVELEGSLFLKSDPKTSKDLIKEWESKKIESDEQVRITNLIIQKASIKALTIEEEVGLPPHIKFPSLSLKKE